MDAHRTIGAFPLQLCAHAAWAQVQDARDVRAHPQGARNELMRRRRAGACFPSHARCWHHPLRPLGCQCVPACTGDADAGRRGSAQRVQVPRHAVHQRCRPCATQRSASEACMCDGSLRAPATACQRTAQAEHGEGAGRHLRAACIQHGVHCAARRRIIRRSLALAWCARVVRSRGVYTLARATPQRCTHRAGLALAPWWPAPPPPRRWAQRARQSSRRSAPTRSAKAAARPASAGTGPQPRAPPALRPCRRSCRAKRPRRAQLSPRRAPQSAPQPREVWATAQPPHRLRPARTATATRLRGCGCQWRAAPPPPQRRRTPSGSKRECVTAQARARLQADTATRHVGQRGA